MTTRLDTPIEQLPRLGARRVKALTDHGVRTVEDLLWIVPFRYEDRSLMTPVADVELERATTVHVRVNRSRLIRTRRRGFTIVEATFEDDSGSLDATFFNQPYLTDLLQPGLEVLLFGTPERRGLFIAMSNPEVEVVSGGDGSIHTGRIVPVYEKIGAIGPRLHRTLIRRILDDLEAPIAETLPAEMITDLGLVSRDRALRAVHFPGDTSAAVDDGRRRLAYEELLVQQLGLRVARGRVRRLATGTPLVTGDDLRQRLRDVLPFRLTAAQRRVLQEIAADLQSDVPMRRLLQGDVGSGKTAVAALAAAIAAWNGGQAALMAPTELLAEQHAATLTGLLERAGFRTTLLTGGLGRARRQEVLDSIRRGEVAVVVGTHALIQRDVEFHRLVLVLIDEQHRFGVSQREGLGAKGNEPHVLVMTATPIPRSLAMTVYGDLDLSILDELPPGRSPVQTVLRVAASEARTYEHVRSEVEKGRQAYIVCPLVEESEKSDLKAAEEWAEVIGQRYFRGLSIGLIHGRMKSTERNDLMARFTRGDVDVLVGTTVVEVGIDVANATVMVIEHAERFGLSQLHQLRGRIGRGRHASTCFLMIRSKGAVTDTARRRLEVMRRTADGFEIAEEDLRLRGPGDMAGTRQWGVPSFRVADLVRDQDLLVEARRWADQLAEDEHWVGSEQARALLARFSRGTGRSDGPCG